jgi:hypothetical protein
MAYDIHVNAVWRLAAAIATGQVKESERRKPAVFGSAF